MEKYCTTTSTLRHDPRYPEELSLHLPTSIHGWSPPLPPPGVGLKHTSNLRPRSSDASTPQHQAASFSPSVTASISRWQALGHFQDLHFPPPAGREACMRTPLRNVSVRVAGKSGSLHEPSEPLSRRPGQVESDRPLHRA